MARAARFGVVSSGVPVRLGEKDVRGHVRDSMMMTTTLRGFACSAAGVPGTVRRKFSFSGSGLGTRSHDATRG